MGDAPNESDKFLPKAEEERYIRVQPANREQNVYEVARDPSSDGSFLATYYLMTKFRSFDDSLSSFSHSYLFLISGLNSPPFSPTLNQKLQRNQRFFPLCFVLFMFSFYQKHFLAHSSVLHEPS